MWTFQISLPKDWREILIAIKDKEGDSHKAYIRNLVKEDLKKRGLV